MNVAKKSSSTCAGVFFWDVTRGWAAGLYNRPMSLQVMNPTRSESNKSKTLEIRAVRAGERVPLIAVENSL